MEKQPPKIVDSIVEFFKFWQNPDGVKEDYLPIKEFQLRIFDVSMDFIFKWYVSVDELKEASDFTEVKIVDNVLSLSLGEYSIELSRKNESCQHTWIRTTKNYKPAWKCFNCGELSTVKKKRHEQ